MQREQRAIVVEHFFEMRNFPALIHAVTAKAAAHLVVNAAFGHVPQSDQRHRAHLRFGMAQQKGEIGWMRKFWRTAKAAVGAVKTLRQ